MTVTVTVTILFIPYSMVRLLFGLPSAFLPLLVVLAIVRPSHQGARASAARVRARRGAVRRVLPGTAVAAAEARAIGAVFARRGAAVVESGGVAEGELRPLPVTRGGFRWWRLL